MFLNLLPTLIAAIYPTQVDVWTLNPGLEIHTSLIPQKNKTQLEPIIAAQAAIAIDVESHKILYAKNINEDLAFASIAKLMVAIIIIEENNLDEIVTINKNYSNIEGSKVGLGLGESFSYRDLLYLMIIPSGNDVATALAELNSETVDEFVIKMNRKAQLIGLKNTVFTNPTGLDDGLQKSSAEDLANLGLYAMQKSLIREISSLKTATINSETGIGRSVINTNQLLDSYLNISGLKTGTTDDAGQCLITIATNPEGREILTVMLNSKDRFQETKSLIDWVWQAYKW